MKKKVLILFAALTFALVSSLTLTLSEPLHYRIASDPTIHGKGKDGDCMDYAIALSIRLAANGIHGRLIFYRWHIKHSYVKNSHVFVLYHLSDGTDWIVDNENEHPKRVPPGTSDLDLVFLLNDGYGRDRVDVELQEGLNHLSYF